MRKILSALVLCASFLVSNAKNSNTKVDSNNKETIAPNNVIKVYAGDFTIKNTTHTGSPLTMLGGYYERRIAQKLYVGIGYVKWTPVLKNNQVLEVTEIPQPIVNDSTGNTLISRRNTKMADLYVFYKAHIPNSSHYFNLCAGVSYAWGVEGHYKEYTSGIGTTIIPYEEKNGSYWGFIPSLTYEYLFPNNLISTGLNIRARFYQGYAKTEYDFGICVGLNF